MDDNAFFKFVWRFNALAIAGAVVVGGLLAAYAVLQVLRYETRDREVTNVVNIGGSERVKDGFVLGSSVRVPGTDFVRLALYRTQETDMGSYSKSSGGNEVNFLFLNTAANTSAWMLPSAGQLFLADTILFDKFVALPTAPRAAVGIVFTVVEQDTDGDKRLTSRDRLSLTVSGPDGTGYRKIADGIGRIISIEQIADDKLLVIYQKDKATVSDIYSVPGLTLQSQQTLPQVELNSAEKP